MLSSSLIAVAFAGVATAVTPSGFKPGSMKDLFVSFGNTLAINGVDLPKADTQTAPTVGTTQRLTGTYTIMMVDPDIPPTTAGGPTSQLLHWMQTGLVSANTTTTIGGMKVYELINPTNAKALASYIGPSPPNKSPQSHRYTQLLLQTSQTGNSTTKNSTRSTSNSTSTASSMATLAKLAMTRSNFSAVNVISSARLTVLAGNSFNVTATSAETGIGLGNSTVPGAAIQASNGTSSSNKTSSSTGTEAASTVKPNFGGKVENGAFIAVLGALSAAFMMF